MTRVGWIRLAVIAGAIATLELCVRLGLVNYRVVIPPSEMAAALFAILRSGSMNADLVRTFGCVLAAVAIAVVLGFTLGVVIHATPRLRRTLDPFFATYYAVPIFIFYPVMVAIFGLSVVPVIMIGVAAGSVAMIIATLNGLDRIPPVLVKVARVHRMSALDTALRLKLPAATPNLFTGVKLAVTYGFIAVIASEFILAPAGIGHEIAFAYNDFNNRRMYGLMLMLLLVATSVNMALHAWDQRLARRRGRTMP
jgi:NitT/TauT family transport system permease protein